METNQSLVFRFTDQQYASRAEVQQAIGPMYTEFQWRSILEYRKKFETPIDFTQYNQIALKFVLTPSILMQFHSTDMALMRLDHAVLSYSLAEKYSTDKVILYWQRNFLKDDLKMLASYEEIGFVDRELELILANSTASLAIKTPVLHYMTFWRDLLKTDLPLWNKNYVRDIAMIVQKNIEEKVSALWYRTTAPLRVDAGGINNDFSMAPASRIPDMMKNAFDFVEGNYDLSPSLQALALMTYMLYVSPFEMFNLELAFLACGNMLWHAGYRHAAPNALPMQYLLRNRDKWENVLLDVKKTGDLTYALVFLNDLLLQTIESRLQELKKLPLPEPTHDPVVAPLEKIVEKIVEVPVGKVVEVEKIVYKDRVIEKEIPVEKIVYVDKPVEKIVYVPFGEEQPEKAPEIVYQDRIVEKPVEKIVYVDKPVDRIVYQDRIIEKEVPVEKIVYVEKPVEKLVYVNQPPTQTSEGFFARDDSADDAEGGPTSAIDERELSDILASQPLLKDIQIRFYLSHRTLGHFYTIDQYKNYADCAYETARTSMDLLASVGYYEKQKAKRKFVYKPIPQEEPK